MKLYLDIETTGLNKHRHSITIVGAYNGEKLIQLIKGADLCEEEVCSLLEQATTLVTFNGKRFDIPFLQAKYPGLCLEDVQHIDLMYLGWRLGWKGGQKAIEQRLGLCRNSGICNGYQAVQLWHAYKQGDKTALIQLLEYNKEDVINLQIIEDAMQKELNNKH